MNNLLNLQNAFQSYLLKNEEDIKSTVVGTAKVSIETRLNIYKDAYQFRLIDALASNYPVLSKYLGQDNFAKIATEYLVEYPSTFRSIRWFGHAFATFLQDHPHYKTFPYLSELAQFEWLQTLVFDAADAPVLQIEQMAAIPPEEWADVRFKMNPSLQQLKLTWNIVEIWEAISQEQIPSEPTLCSSDIWIFWRRELINRFILLNEKEAEALAALLNQATLGEMAEILCRETPEDEAGMKVASLLKHWIQLGLISEVLVK